jgi:hypothetical protein
MALQKPSQAHGFPAALGALECAAAVPIIIGSPEEIVEGAAEEAEG